MYCIQKLNPTQFDCFAWRCGSPLTLLGMHIREGNIFNYRTKLLRLMVGYCDGESLVCRPKANHKAVMFYINGELCWFHFRNKEFENYV